MNEKSIYQVWGEEAKRSALGTFQPKGGREKGGQILVRPYQEDSEKIEEIARETKISKAEIVRALIEKGLKDPEIAKLFER